MAVVAVIVVRDHPAERASEPAKRAAEPAERAGEPAERAGEPIGDVAPDTRTVPRLLDESGLDPLLSEALVEAVYRVEGSPESPDAWGALANLYSAHGFPAPAAECYDEARRLEPGEAAWHYYAGLLAFESGRSEDAVDDFRETLRLRPDYLPAYRRSGATHLARADTAAARDAFGKLATRSPDSPWGHLGLGKVAWREDRLDDARSHLERAVDLEPPVREAVYLLALVDRAQGREGDAASRLAKLETVPETLMPDPLAREVAALRVDLGTRIAEAARLRTIGREREAETMYREVLSIDPGSFDARSRLGVLLAQSRRFEEAESHLQHARALRPGSADTCFNLALVHLETDRPESAIRLLEAALENDPGHTRSRELLRTLQRRGSRKQVGVD